MPQKPFVKASALLSRAPRWMPSIAILGQKGIHRLIQGWPSILGVLADLVDLHASISGLLLSSKITLQSQASQRPSLTLLPSVTQCCSGQSGLAPSASRTYPGPSVLGSSQQRKPPRPSHCAPSRPFVCHSSSWHSMVWNQSTQTHFGSSFRQGTAAGVSF